MTCKRNEVDYELLVHGRKKIFHINMLKKYEERCPPSVSPSTTCMVLADDTEHGVLLYSGSKSMGVEKIQICPSMKKSEALELQDRLQRYAVLFSDVPGRTTVQECKLQLTSDRPVYVNQYPLPLAVQEDIEKEVESMLKQGIVERSNSAYNAPLVAVKKPDGSTRVCVDFRGLNNILVSDAEPIPRVDVVFTKVADKKFFSKPDLTKGY